MPELNTVIDPNLPEPKGVLTASAGMVYVADGLGSGTWQLRPEGFGYYQHSTAGQVIGTTVSKLLIDGLGELSYSGALPAEIRGAGELWDTTNSKISPIRLYDDYSIRVDLPVTAESGSPTELEVAFDIGGGASPTVVIVSKYFKTGKAVPYFISFELGLPALSTTTVTNGVQIFLVTDSGSVTLGVPAIRITRNSDGGQ